MMLSKTQRDDLAPWKTHLTLWERDLLAMAGDFENWLDIAVDLGFSVEKIMKPWTFPDAGRRVKIMTWEEYNRCCKILHESTNGKLPVCKTGIVGSTPTSCSIFAGN